MAINLIPPELKTTKDRRPKKFKPKSLSGAAPDLSASPLGSGRRWIMLTFLPLALAGFIFVQIKAKEKTLDFLARELQGYKETFQKIAELTDKKKGLNEELSRAGDILKSRIRWSDKIFLINKLIPKQVWLSSINTEMGEAKALTIKGSAVSLVSSEIIGSISLFAEKLRQEAVFNKDFSEIVLGQILAEKKGDLTVMSFTLSCKFKQ